MLMRAPEGRTDPALSALADRYLAFLAYAQTPDGWFHNFMDYHRQWVDSEGSEDCFARAVQACVEVMVAEASSAEPPASHPTATDLAPPQGGQTGRFLLARRLWQRALPHIPRLRAVRAQAICLLSLQRYYEYFPEHTLPLLIRGLADRLLESYRRCSGPGWHWFEETITYGNASLPQALLAAYRTTGHHRHLGVGRQTLDFLAESCLRAGFLKLVGNRNWYRRGTRPAEFDEQPIDAGLFTEAALEAWHTTGSRSYFDLAHTSLEWFHGRNQHRLPLADPLTGGCCDGITPEGVNLNQGAESLLAYLWAGLLMSGEARKGSISVPVKSRQQKRGWKVEAEGCLASPAGS
ncbi:MAG TPA: hypothetical protein GX513_11170 [Firmicutes bacterium]|nr:hypothetical protein [Bacillota bacterium]